MSAKIKMCLTLLAVILWSTISLAAEDKEAPPPLASHHEIEPIGKTKETKFDKISTFCLSVKGDLLVCDSGAQQIKVVNPAGKLLDKWKLDFAPHAIEIWKDQGIYVAGNGIVALLDKSGKVIKTAKADTDNFTAGKPSGLAVTEKDVFIAFGTGWSLRSLSTVVRLDHNLDNPTVIVEKLRGCCQRLDMVARDGSLFVAENARHRVVKYDREGKILAKWGSRDPKNIKGFGSCCNPMNLFFNKKGELYTSESGLGRVKKYTIEGKFLSLVGYVGTTRFNRAGRTAAQCSNISVASNKDESRVYVLDYDKCLIRVLARNDDNSDKTETESPADTQGKTG